jgi:hypothetical protein
MSVKPLPYGTVDYSGILTVTDSEKFKIPHLTASAVPKPSAAAFF